MTLNNSKPSSSPTVSTNTGSNNAPTDPFSVTVDGSAGRAMVRNCNNKRIKFENPTINLLGGTDDMVNTASETLETVKRVENGLDGVKKTVDIIQLDKFSVTQGISQSQTAASDSTKEDRDSKDFTASLSRDTTNPGSPNVAGPTSLPENDMSKTINQMHSTSLSSNPGSMYPSIGNEKRGSGFILSLKAGKDVKLPKTVPKDVKAYMLSNMDGLGPASKYSVRLWDPYRIFKNGREVQPLHCMVGDVGKFRSDGGFDVKFNIFLSKEENVRMKYAPPPTFEPLAVVGDYEEVKLFKNKVYSSSCIEWDKDETRNEVFTMKSMGKPESFGMAVLVVPNGCEKEMVRPGILDDITEYFNNNLRSWDDPNSFDNLRDGSWNIIITAYRSTVWGGAGLRKSKYQDSLQSVLQARFKRADDQRDYEWEASGTHSSFQCTQSHNSSLGDVPCTIAIELLSITRESLSSRMSSSLVSAVSTLGSILSLGHRSKE